MHKKLNAPIMERVILRGYQTLSEQPDPGGPLLLLPMIEACLVGLRSIWLPFRASAPIAFAASMQSVEAIVHSQDFAFDQPNWFDHMPYAEACYLGTPTILDDRALFPSSCDDDGWNVQTERRMVRTTAVACERKGYRYLLTGLGSGDISITDRCFDMMGGGPPDNSIQVLASLSFEGFDDYLIRREL